MHLFLSGHIENLEHLKSYIRNKSGKSVNFCNNIADAKVLFIWVENEELHNIINTIQLALDLKMYIYVGIKNDKENIFQQNRLTFMWCHEIEFHANVQYAWGSFVYNKKSNIDDKQATRSQLIFIKSLAKEKGLFFLKPKETLTINQAGAFIHYLTYYDEVNNYTNTSMEEFILSHLKTIECVEQHLQSLSDYPLDYRFILNYMKKEYYWGEITLLKELKNFCKQNSWDWDHLEDIDGMVKYDYVVRKYWFSQRFLDEFVEFTKQKKPIYTIFDLKTEVERIVNEKYTLKKFEEIRVKHINSQDYSKVDKSTNQRLFIKEAVNEIVIGIKRSKAPYQYIEKENVNKDDYRYSFEKIKKMVAADCEITQKQTSKVIREFINFKGVYTPVRLGKDYCNIEILPDDEDEDILQDQPLYNEYFLESLKKFYYESQKVYTFKQLLEAINSHGYSIGKFKLENIIRTKGIRKNKYYYDEMSKKFAYILSKILLD